MRVWGRCRRAPQIPYIVETFTLPVGIKTCRAKVRARCGGPRGRAG